MIQFNSSMINIVPVQNQQDEYLLLNDKDIYTLKKTDDDLTIFFNGDPNNIETITGFINGQNGIILPNEPIIQKNNFPVSSYSERGTDFAKVIRIDNDTFFTVWSSLCGVTQCNVSVYGQISDKVTGFTNSFVQINTEPIQCSDAWSRVDVAAATLTNEDIAVIWLETVQSCGFYGGWLSVAGQVLSQDGQKIGNKIVMGSNDYGTHIDKDRGITALPNSKFAVSFAGVYDLVVKIFSSTGSELAALSRDSANGGFGTTDLATLENGNFVLVFTLLGTARGEIFDEFGTVIVSQFIVANENANVPKVSSIGNSNFIITWLDNTSVIKMLGKIYSATGNVVYNDFFVEDFYTVSLPLYSIAFLGGSSILISYQIDFSLFGKVLNLSGEIISREFPITSSVYGNNFYPHIAPLEQDEAVVVWTNQGTPSEHYIYGAILDISNLDYALYNTSNCNLVGNTTDNTLTVMPTCTGNNIIAGLAGDDILSSNVGTNLYIGGPGADVFVVYPDAYVTILDFDINIPNEKIDVSALLGEINILQNGPDTIISFENLPIVLLKDVNSSAIIVSEDGNMISPITESPTYAPTQTPTSLPTHVPTSLTSMPTVLPTELPTISTVYPTVDSTINPIATDPSSGEDSKIWPPNPELIYTAIAVTVGVIIGGVFVWYCSKSNNPVVNNHPPVVNNHPPVVGNAEVVMAGIMGDDHID